VLGLKGNQSALLEAVEDFFYVAEAGDFAGVRHDFLEEVDKDHGRLERRRYWITEDLRTLPDTEQWKGLRSILPACRLGKGAPPWRCPCPTLCVGYATVPGGFALPTEYQNPHHAATMQVLGTPPSLAALPNLLQANRLFHPVALGGLPGLIVTPESAEIFRGATDGWP